MEKRQNEGAGKTVNPRENPPTSGIVRHDSHMLKSGTDPAGNQTRFALVGGEGVEVDVSGDEESSRSIVKQVIDFFSRFFRHIAVDVSLLSSFPGATVAERLDCSPPTKADRVNPRPVHSGFSQVGIMPDAAANRRVFSGISRSPAPSFRRCSILTSLYPYRLLRPRYTGVPGSFTTRVCVKNGRAIYRSVARTARSLKSPAQEQGLQETRGHGGLAISLLASHQGDPGLIPGRVTPGFSHVGIVPDDAVSRRVFSGISRFPHPFILVLPLTSITLIGSQDLDTTRLPPRRTGFDYRRVQSQILLSCSVGRGEYSARTHFPFNLNI
ncbi:hypothetical protein PR048_024794 [Dryococelus australis]|uniref:Uncharacterized protein n=1 Tax=Dryococelus australis TaxID=614101 RepID=A0ABQ9GPM4_9NEOP|nr:hypothetical protein PR048_024794 [Dryococelus australis]